MKMLLSTLLLLAAIAGRAQFQNEEKTLEVTTQGHVYQIRKGPTGDTVDATHEMSFPSQKARYDTMLKIIVFNMEKNWEHQQIEQFQLQDRIWYLQHQVDSLRARPVIYLDEKNPKKPSLWVKCPDGSCDILIKKLY